MKKLLALFIVLGTIWGINSANAREIIVEGQGAAPLTGYNIKAVRDMQDSKMDKKAKNSNYEVLQTQQVKEATRQAKTRKKEDMKLTAELREQVVSLAEENAVKAAVTNLIEQILGAGASENPTVKSKFEAIVSQLGNYTITKDFSGEVRDNNYIARASLRIDEEKFRNIVKKLGAAINTNEVRSHSVMIVMDEFFTRESNLNKNVLTEEVTTLDYKYKERDKQTEKASYKDSGNSAAGGGYSSRYGGGAYGASSKHNTSASYGNFQDYSQDESLFFQNVKKYDVAAPKADNLNFTVPALQNAFGEHSIKTKDNAVLKSRYFKGKPITSDKLETSAELANYVDVARDAGADFFAIGVSYITDNGVDPHTGKHRCTANVFVRVFSTVDSEAIASGTMREVASGASADEARTAAAAQVGKNLGEQLAIRMNDFWTERLMYGFDFNVQIKGNLSPMEKIAIYEALENMNEVKNIEERTDDSTKVEYDIKYSGKNIKNDILKTLYKLNPTKFQTYNCTRKSNVLMFAPSSFKGVQNL